VVTEFNKFIEGLKVLKYYLICTNSNGLVETASIYLTLILDYLSSIVEHVDFWD
jgi:hypothetical protein